MEGFHDREVREQLPFQGTGWVLPLLCNVITGSQQVTADDVTSSPWHHSTVHGEMLSLLLYVHRHCSRPNTHSSVRVFFFWVRSTDHDKKHCHTLGEDRVCPFSQSVVDLSWAGNEMSLSEEQIILTLWESVFFLFCLFSLSPVQLCASQCVLVWNKAAASFCQQILCLSHIIVSISKSGFQISSPLLFFFVKFGGWGVCLCWVQ